MAKAPFGKWSMLPSCVLWAGLTGCAASPTSLPPLSTTPANVSPSRLGRDPFEDMTCERLKSEKGKRQKTLADLKHPPLFPSNTEEEREKQLTQVQGEIKAIGKVQVDKKCPGAGAADWSTFVY
jgi:hypothetical protein